VQNRDLLISLVREVQSLGFDEIQLDYIRFPVHEGTKFAMFPGEGEKPRREAPLGMLRRMDEALRIPDRRDVFGLAAYKHGDPAGAARARLGRAKAPKNAKEREGLNRQGAEERQRAREKV